MVFGRGKGTAGFTVRETKDAEGTQGLEAEFEVAAPRALLLDLLWDTKNFPELFPEVLEVHVLATEGERMSVEYAVDAVLKRVRYRLERTRDREAGVIAWRETGGDLKRVRGEWRMAEAAGGTHLTYRAFVAVGYFVPTSVVRDVAMRKVGEMVERVRRVAEARVS
jgi:carbon monoxide dehydrogenase subunit G